MADERVIRETIETYLKVFTAGDRDGYVGLFTDDATVEDPVGSPVHHGKDAIGAFFDTSQQLADAIELRSLGITNVCADQAAFAFEIRPTIAGTTYTLPGIDVMTFADDGRITSMRAYFQMEHMRPDSSGAGT